VKKSQHEAGTGLPLPGAHETRVLVLPPTGADGRAMAKVFGNSQIPCEICASVQQLCEALRVGGAVVTLSEEALVGDPTLFLACIADQPVWADLPVIVLSRAGRESPALAEILPRLGNVSVVERPVRTSTLISLVRSCLRARERQYTVREYLAGQAQAEIEREQLLDSERAARSEAERASRTKDEFLATLSHELRTPLNAVLGWSQLLRRSANLPDDVANGLVVIERNARSQAQIIEDLLDMSSIISGKVRLEVQRLDLASVIEATVETVRPAAQTKGIRLHVVVDPLAGPVRGDPNRLQQVLWNLLTNAVKFTPQGGRVGVALARINSHLEIEVTDNGEGIEPKFLPHIFDRFRQADASTARRHGGLGLGLSIVKQLIELHGGAIIAHSAGLGMGSTFRITLPLMAISSDPLETASSAQHSARSIDAPPPPALGHINLTGVSVLVVDDECDARTLIQRFLQECDANVFTAASAVEAMHVLLHESPTVLVSDIGMPGEDGYELIRRVRSLKDANARIPAVALTAYARVEDRVRAVQAGYQLHLSKPVKPIELIAMIESLAKGSSYQSVGQ
jgi:signal transduction histidine kinase/ActR/RegA family two-component response regulator